MISPNKPFDFGGRDELLRNADQAAIYLEECLVDGDMELFQEALRNVAKAQKGGVKAVAEQAELSRENLYRALSKKGKPQMETITKMLAALGMRISITAVR